MADFSKNEAIEMAIQIEQQGYDFYSNAAAGLPEGQAKALFEWLAAEELRHIQVFQNFRDQMDQLQLAGPYDWDEVGRYLRSLTEGRVFPSAEEAKNLAKKAENLSEVFRFAIQIEKENILYFHELNDFVAEKDKPVIQKLIDEEKSHIRRLVDLKRQMGVG
ncbi:MAG: ferritin family protein [Calditrichaeota bacterium]|nr:ferritin family protein [Calditrichota bacterium]